MMNICPLSYKSSENKLLGHRLFSLKYMQTDYSKYLSGEKICKNNLHKQRHKTEELPRSFKILDIILNKQIRKATA